MKILPTALSGTRVRQHRQQTNQYSKNSRSTWHGRSSCSNLTQKSSLQFPEVRGIKINRNGEKTKLKTRSWFQADKSAKNFGFQLEEIAPQWLSCGQVAKFKILGSYCNTLPPKPTWNINWSNAVSAFSVGWFTFLVETRGSEWSGEENGGIEGYRIYFSCCGASYC